MRGLWMSAWVIVWAWVDGVAFEAAAQVHAQRPEASGSPGLERRLRPLIAAHKGDVGVMVKHLGTGETFAHRADAPMPTASLIKFPLLIEAYRRVATGALDLKTPVTLHDEDKVPGAGILTYHFSQGTTIPLRDVLRLMIVYSDNTATNLALDAVGLDAVNAEMARLGLKRTKFHSKVYRRDTSIDPEGSREFGLGVTTAAEMITLWERLHLKKLAEGNEALCDAMLDHLLHCDDKSMLVKELPPGTKVAQKTGAVSDVRTAAGILYTPSGPIAVCVLTARNQDQRWTPDNAAERFSARLAREVYDHFQQAADLKEAGRDDSPLAFGATGPRVERLQRLLNRRLEPSPGLVVDGDFGPATQEAVIRFQKERHLGDNGVVTPEVWRALGELPPDPAGDPQAEADPAQLNAEFATLRPEPAEPAANDPTAVPFVTARAWVAIDADTGRVLGGREPERPLDMASTTKIMTAHLVLKELAAHPEARDEVVTFSARAAATPGSSSEVREGERVRVGELLYGLMLPSGNDAAVALAEQFGQRLAARDGSDGLDPLEAFVAAMNREAQALGLSATRFVNPHGLTAPNHQASALDLARLTRVALENPEFAALVATRRRAARLIDGEGKGRTIVWSNTNELLKIEGFAGVKTGTTSSAGACLVALGQQGERRVIVVVLGSAASASRYADARNLFRWAFHQPVAAPIETGDGR
ncbi:peptidase S11 D-alanyl-D-alanine carboxypeptidase 1 [Isosphaera pallida ATCC 43644]|uniref:Peptidase S11 D-alanyl-D-alanine carboxypeptidase 1 n=1 Tax=Isosphaera pallida (strain ATCC 43644 / DSM 9630 / IS1B) TaxID=575540 RepID=E8R687_ISOPI|nr:serine hydrolase [Isosphaera pallida]ADV60782.1 peptidase S11 D-alanyl-D-alanine carboxypeptidase 1 [Isosphaera pallida ATCC 43644]